MITGYGSAPDLRDEICLLSSVTSEAGDVTFSLVPCTVACWVINPFCMCRLHVNISRAGAVDNGVQSNPFCSLHGLIVYIRCHLCSETHSHLILASTCISVKTESESRSIC